MIYTAGVKESLKNIFSAIVVGMIDKGKTNIRLKQETFRGCLPRFLATFSDNIFQDEYAFLYEVIKTLKIKVFSAKQLDEIIERNRDVILKSDKIDLSSWDLSVDDRPTTEDEKIEAFRLNVMDLAEELSNTVVTEEEYMSSSEIFINYYVEQTALETAQHMAVIMSETGMYVTRKGRKVLYKGRNDADKYYAERTEILNSLSDEDSVEHIVVDEKWLADEINSETEENDDGILTYGLDEIDDVLGPIQRTYMITILGPTKGGKTKFTSHLVDRALESGLNVCVWSLDGTPEEWKANIVAHMIRSEFGVAYRSKDIERRRYESNEMREMVMAAKTRLATDCSRGRLSFIESTAYCETLIDTLKVHYQKINPFDIIVIDPLINVQSKYGKPKTDRIATAYIDLKNFIKNGTKQGIAAIIPAQLKQSVIEDLRRNGGDMEITAAGESAEVIRSSDEIIGMFSSKDERRTNRMRFQSVASRHSETFYEFMAHCELGCSYFESDATLNM